MDNQKAGIQALKEGMPEIGDQIDKLLNQNNPLLVNKLANLGNQLYSLKQQSAISVTNEQKALFHLNSQVQQNRLAYSANMGSRGVSGGFAASAMNQLSQNEIQSWTSLQNNAIASQLQNEENINALKTQANQIVGTTS